MGEVYQAEAKNMENEQEIFSNPEKVVENQNLTVMEGKAVMEPDEIKAEDTEENREILNRVKSGIGEIESIWWRLGTDLYHVRENHLFELEGYETFVKYAKQVCDIEKRMAHYHCTIHEFFRIDLKKMMADRLDEYNAIIALAPTLGLTRCIRIAICSNVTSGNLMPLMQAVQLPDGRLKTVREVEEMLSDLAGQLEPIDKSQIESSDEELENKTADKPASFSCKLEKTQAKSVEDALDIAAKLSESDKKSINLAHICSHFVANNSATGNRTKDVRKQLSMQEEFLNLTIIGIDQDDKGILYGPKKIETLLKLFQNCLGVSLVALDTDKNEIVFGQDTLAQYSDSE